MNEAKSTIMERLRQALASEDAGEGRRRAVDARLARHEPVLVPARARVEGEARIALFTEMAEAVQTEVQRLDSFAEIATATARYLRRHNLPQKLVAAPDPLLDAAGWEKQPLLRVRRGNANPEDAVGMTLAFAGIAETGTLMLVSAPERPVMLAFLPETCIVVLPLSRLDGCYEESWARLRQQASQPPRAVNFVTGPSRTADIANTLTLGAHGPRRLFVLLVPDPEAQGPEPEGDA